LRPPAHCRHGACAGPVTLHTHGLPFSVRAPHARLHTRAHARRLPPPPAHPTPTPAFTSACHYLSSGTGHSGSWPRQCLLAAWNTGWIPAGGELPHLGSDGITAAYAEYACSSYSPAVSVAACDAFASLLVRRIHLTRRASNAFVRSDIILHAHLHEPGMDVNGLRRAFAIQERHLCSVCCAPAWFPIPFAFLASNAVPRVSVHLSATYGDPQTGSTCGRATNATAPVSVVATYVLPHPPPPPPPLPCPAPHTYSATRTHCPPRLRTHTTCRHCRCTHATHTTHLPRYLTCQADR